MEVLAAIVLDEVVRTDDRVVKLDVAVDWNVPEDKQVQEDKQEHMDAVLAFLLSCNLGSAAIR